MTTTTRRTSTELTLRRGLLFTASLPLLVVVALTTAADAQTRRPETNVTYSLRFVHADQLTRGQLAGEREAVRRSTAALPDFDRTDSTRIHLMREGGGARRIVTDAVERGGAQELSTVRLSAPLGQPALWVVGRQAATPTLSTRTGQPAPSPNAVLRRDFGFRLRLTSWRLPGGGVRVRVQSVVRTPDFGNSTVRAGRFFPRLETRRADSYLDLKVGQSFGITGTLDAGLLRKLARVSQVESGKLFRKLRDQQTSRASSSLVLIVTLEAVQNKPGPGGK